MEKMNISIFLNYKKSKNIFLLLKRFWKWNLLKWKLRKQYKINSFKNNYQIFHSTNKQVHRYFCFKECKYSIVVVDKETIQDSSLFILELKSIVDKVIFLVDTKEEKDIEKLGKSLQVPIVGINSKNIIKILQKKQESTRLEIASYPPLVEDQLQEIENLFPVSIDEKKKRFLTLQLFEKDFPFIDEILNAYQVDKYAYFRRKQELIEYGYTPEYLSELYWKFYEKQYQRIIEYE